MIPELDATDIGRQLGADGVNSVVAKVEQYCAYAEQRTALKNHPSILGLRAELSLLSDEERELQDRLSHAPPTGDLRHKRRKAIYAWTITVLLTGAGFFFALLSFEPFRLGWKSYVYCLGIAVVVPFLVDKLLDDNRLDKVVKALTAVAATAGITSLMVLAVIRGDLLAQQIQAPSAVVIDGDQPVPDTPNTFYGSTLGLLRIATVLLSLAMELGAGLALREAWKMLPQDSVDWEKLRDERRQVHQRMVALATEVTRLEDEAALFAAQFWRDFYGSMLTHTVRSAMTKLLVLVAGVVLIPHALAATNPHLNLVVAVDLTKSVAVKGPDGTTEFQKNVDGVAHVLAEVPSGARVSVIGITDRSFAQPYILLSASVPDDPGYFGERLSAARTALVRAWKLRSVRLQSSFSSTDIVGALMLASQIFNQQSSHGDQRTLVLFSDMRNHTHELDMESPSAVSALGSPAKAANAATVDLHAVQVYALGVDGAGKPTAYWQEIEVFWTTYFQKSGASLNGFSALRELPGDSGSAMK
jgi:hypothetical protein